MAMVASRELRNHTVAVLDRVRAGEDVRITVHGAVVAELRPVSRLRLPTLHRNQLAQLLHGAAPDPDLAALLTEISAETTDDL